MINHQRRYSWVKLWIVIWTLLNVQFFLLPSIYSWFSWGNTYHNKLIVTILAIIVFIVHFISGSLQKRTSYFDLQIITYILLVTSTLLLQLLIGDISLIEGFSNSYYQYILLAYFPLAYYLRRIPDLFQYIKKIMIICGCLFILANTVCYLYYEVFRERISSVPLYQFVNGRIRLPQSADIAGITALMLLESIFTDKRNRCLKICLFVLCFFELFIIASVRMALLAVAISTAYTLYIKTKRKIIWLLLSILVFMLILYDLLFNNEITLISNIIGTGQRYNSALYRLTEIKHFAKHYFHLGIFGFGFTSDPSILRYSTTDIGVFAFVFRYGIMGSVWLIIWILYMLQLLKRADSLFVHLFVSYLLVSFISLSFFDAQRICMFPLILAMIKYEITKKQY